MQSTIQPKYPQKTDPLVVFVSHVLAKKTDVLAVRWLEILFKERGLPGALDAFCETLLLERMEPKFSENGMILRLYPHVHPHVFCITQDDADETGVGNLMRKISSRRPGEEYTTWMAEYVDSFRMVQRTLAILLRGENILEVFYYVESSLQRLEKKAKTVRVCRMRQFLHELVEWQANENGNTSG
jgi:hypothetical protein